MKNRFGCRRGNAMIEFALAWSLLVPLFLGTFQFGYTFYVYNMLCTQTRAAARFASLKTFKCKSASGISSYKTAVSNVVRFGNPDGTGTLIAPNLSAAQVQVSIKDINGVDADASHVPSYVTVTTANYSVGAVVTSFNFNDKPLARFPYVGRYAPGE